MRKLIVKLILFAALFRWLGTVDILVLLVGMATVIAIMICVDVLLDSASPR